MNIKLISAGIFVAILLLTHWFTYKAGINKERADDALVIAKYKKKVTKLIDELEVVKAKRNEVIHEKVVVIKKVKSECADTIIDKSILDQLQ